MNRREFIKAATVAGASLGALGLFCGTAPAAEPLPDEDRMLFVLRPGKMESRTVHYPDGEIRDVWEVTMNWEMEQIAWESVKAGDLVMIVPKPGDPGMDSGPQVLRASHDGYPLQYEKF